VREVLSFSVPQRKHHVRVWSLPVGSAERPAVRYAILKGEIKADEAISRTAQVES